MFHAMVAKNFWSPPLFSFVISHWALLLLRCVSGDGSSLVLENDLVTSVVFLCKRRPLQQQQWPFINGAHKFKRVIWVLVGRQWPTSTQIDAFYQ